MHVGMGVCPEISCIFSHHGRGALLSDRGRSLQQKATPLSPILPRSEWKKEQLFDMTMSLETESMPGISSRSVYRKLLCASRRGRGRGRGRGAGKWQERAKFRGGISKSGGLILGNKLAPPPRLTICILHDLVSDLAASRTRSMKWMPCVRNSPPCIVLLCRFATGSTNVSSLCNCRAYTQAARTRMHTGMHAHTF